MKLCLVFLLSTLGPLTLLAAPAKPNILWLLIEDCSPSAFGCYGQKQVSTPNIDRMAAEGVKYLHAYTTAPVCSPSRSAMITGMYQTTIGAQNHRSHRTDGYQLPSGVRVLTDLLREAGYFTGNIVDLPESFGFKGTGKTDWNFTVPEKVFDTKSWSDLKGHQPFMAQVNFQETHRNFHAPSHADRAKIELPPYYPDDPIVREDYGKYLDAATEVDRKIGLILTQLEQDGLAENTIIFCQGDNGEAMARGKQFCYEEGFAVPFIVRWPKGIPRPANFKPGTVDAQLVEMIDLAPTYLTLAGAPVPPKMQGHVLFGEHAAPPRQYAFGARDRCDETVMRIRSVRDAKYRYIYDFTPEVPFLASNQYKEKQYPVVTLLPKLMAAGKLTPPQAALCAPRMPQEELYDLDADPHEIHNLAADPAQAAVKKRMHDALFDWIEKSDDQGRFMEPQAVVDRESGFRVQRKAQDGKGKASPAGAR